MVTAAQQIDRRLEALKPLAGVIRPSRGWIRAVREGLGMTTRHIAKRLDVKQPRIIEMERAEVSGNITMKTLERAAEALGCRLVYAFVPEKPLSETIRQRAALLADRQLASVEHTMRLEAQDVTDEDRRRE